MTTTGKVCLAYFQTVFDFQIVFLGFYTVNLLCFRENRVNIEGVSTDKATRKSVHKFWRNSHFSFFDVYYFHVCVKFMIFSEHQKKKKSLFMRQLSKKVHHLESAQHTFSDHSHQKRNEIFKCPCTRAIHIYSLHTKKLYSCLLYTSPSPRDAQ